MEHVEKTAVITTVGEPQTVQTLQTLGENVIYLMGFSFILGSLFTILILILLDFMRRNSINSIKHG